MDFYSDRALFSFGFSRLFGVDDSAVSVAIRSERTQIYNLTGWLHRSVGCSTKFLLTWIKNALRLCAGHGDNQQHDYCSVYQIHFLLCFLLTLSVRFVPSHFWILLFFPHSRVNSNALVCAPIHHWIFNCILCFFNRSNKRVDKTRTHQMQFNH